MATTNIASYSFTHCIIPHIWKQGKIMTLLKANKTHTQAASYRPIKLLCTPSSIIECPLLHKITPHIPLHSIDYQTRKKYKMVSIQDTTPQNTINLQATLVKLLMPPVLINKICSKTFHTPKCWLTNCSWSKYPYLHPTANKRHAVQETPH